MKGRKKWYLAAAFLTFIFIAGIFVLKKDSVLVFKTNAVILKRFLELDLSAIEKEFDKEELYQQGVIIRELEDIKSIKFDHSYPDFIIENLKIGDSRETIINRLGDGIENTGNELYYQTRDYYLVIDISPGTDTARSFLFVPETEDLISVHDFYTVYKDIIARPGRQAVYAPNKKVYAVEYDIEQTGMKSQLIAVSNGAEWKTHIFTADGPFENIEWLSSRYLLIAGETFVIIYDYQEDTEAEYSSVEEFLDKAQNSTDIYTPIPDTDNHRIIFYEEDVIAGSVSYSFTKNGDIFFSESSVTISTGQITEWINESAYKLYENDKTIILSDDRMEKANKLEASREVLAFTDKETGVRLMFSARDAEPDFFSVVKDSSGYRCEFIEIFNGTLIEFSDGQIFTVGSDLKLSDNWIDIDEKQETWYYGEEPTSKITAEIDGLHFVFVADSSGDFRSYKTFVGNIGYDAVKGMPDFPNEGSSLDDFVPDEWTIAAYAEGDFNGDGRDDIAAVVIDHNAESSDGILLILFGEQDGYQLNLADPYTIQDYYLTFEDIIYVPGGFALEWGYQHRGAWEHTDTYKYIEDNWYLTNYHYQAESFYGYLTGYDEENNYESGYSHRKYVFEDYFSISNDEKDQVEFEIKSGEPIRMSIYAIRNYSDETLDGYPTKEVTMADGINISENRVSDPGSATYHSVSEDGRKIIYKFYNEPKSYIASYDIEEQTIHVFFEWEYDENNYRLSSLGFLNDPYFEKYVYLEETILDDGDRVCMRVVGIHIEDGSTKTIFTTDGKSVDFSVYTSLDAEIYGDKMILYIYVSGDKKYYYCIDLQNQDEQYLGSVLNL